MSTAMTVRCDWCGEEIRWNDQRVWIHDADAPERRELLVHARCVSKRDESFQDSPQEKK
jgi:hypothetical protein